MKISLDYRVTNRKINHNYCLPGYYFITIILKDRLELLGEIKDSKMVLNEAGEMIRDELKIINENFPYFSLKEFIVMPNHIHFILSISNKKNIVQLGTVIRWFKTRTTNKYIKGVKSKKWAEFNLKLWQRNYYDHIIKDAVEYKSVVYYILNNPKN